MPKLARFLGLLMYRFGFHNFRVLNKTFEFGAGAGIETVKCKRCGTTMTRRNSDSLFLYVECSGDQLSYRPIG